VANDIAKMRDAGIRHFIADFVGPAAEGSANAERFMTEFVPPLG